MAASVHITKIEAIVGWPVFMAATMLRSNALGITTREWRGCGPATFGWHCAGFPLLVATVVLASLSNRCVGV